MLAFLLLGLGSAVLLTAVLTPTDDQPDDGGAQDDGPPDAGNVGAVRLGGAGDDALTGAGGEDLLLGFNGADTLTGAGGPELLAGDQGGDLIFGGGGRDVLLGGAGADTLSGGTDGDLMVGGTGDDRMSGDAGNDLLIGMNGNNRLDGGTGDDTLIGLTPGGPLDPLIDLDPAGLRDYLTVSYPGLSAAQVNRIISTVTQSDGGAVSRDTLTGGDGNDLLVGDVGDFLTGGAGSDAFLVAPPSGGDPSLALADRVLSVTDFDPALDQLRLFVPAASPGLVAVQAQPDGLVVTVDGEPYAFLAGRAAGDLTADMVQLRRL